MRNSDNMKKVVPYLHNVSHALKKIGRKVKVDVVFSAPQKSLSSTTDPLAKKCAGCKKNQWPTLVSHVKNAMYLLSLSCGEVYIGQPWRCLNCR